MTTNMQAAAVTVYTQPSCQPCRATKRWLDKRGITYTQVDVTHDPTAAEYVKDLGYLAAPVVITSDGAHWNEFRPDLLEEALV